MDPTLSLQSTPPATAPATPAPPAAPAPPGRAISSDFNTFLRMLTVQMQNQDPLDPIDSADFAVQLATFSGVEQQVRTNELLGQLSGLLRAPPSPAPPRRSNGPAWDREARRSPRAFTASRW
jgi:flagellar basal-body rod modification protein FlgD